MAPAVIILTQGFAHSSLQVAALPEMCEDQLGVLALHLLTSLSKKLGSCGDQDTTENPWLKQKDNVKRWLHLWSEEKQNLFLKKIPA